MSYSDQETGKQYPLKVYWQPGCSSCLKTKEFLFDNGMKFDSINVLEDDRGFKELEALGTEQTRKTLLRHGAKEPFFGVKIGEMQAIRKKIVVDYQLALDLYDTGNYDAIYFA